MTSQTASSFLITPVDTKSAGPSMARMTGSGQKQTPLYTDHLKLGAKMIPFGEWIMPVQYNSIVEEHQAVRNHVGLFDISHMGQLVVTGQNAATWLNEMLTNNVDRLEVGQGQYTFLLADNGGIIDDLIVYRTKPTEFLLVVNASRTEEDHAWLKSHLTDNITLRDQSADYGGLAIQGPRVNDLLRAVLGPETPLPARNQIFQLTNDKKELLIARTGYTGEDGFEVFLPANQVSEFWNLLLDKGKALGAKPCGLGARDTLRLEMCYPLNGSDLSPDRNPIEAGLAFFVDLQKPKFVGREVLAQAKEQGTAVRLAAFRMKGKGPPPRPHYKVWVGQDQIGETTSGTLSPSLNQGIGMAYLPTQHTRAGTEIEIEIRGQRFPAIIEKKPLYKKP